MKNLLEQAKRVELSTYAGDVWADVQNEMASYVVRHISKEYDVDSVVERYKKDGFEVSIVD